MLIYLDQFVDHDKLVIKAPNMSYTASIRPNYKKLKMNGGAEKELLPGILTAIVWERQDQLVKLPYKVFSGYRHT